MMDASVDDLSVSAASDGEKVHQVSEVLAALSCSTSGKDQVEQLVADRSFNKQIFITYKDVVLVPQICKVLHTLSPVMDHRDRIVKSTRKHVYAYICAMLIVRADETVPL